MGAFNGQLRSNEIFAALYNMIISQEVFADNLGKHQTLVDKARVDGSLHGDTKLYYATDVLASFPWGADAEATDLLSLDRPETPQCQEIVLDVFRQIRVTIDNYLSKRAWSTEGAFSSFNGVITGWLKETKKVYDGTIYNAYIGTAEGQAAKSTVSVDLTTAIGSATGIEAAQLEAQEIARVLANLLVEMGDYSRDFNDYGFLRSYSNEAIKVVWNSEYLNKIKKVDLPTIFHKEGLVDKMEEDVLPARYFGRLLTSADAAEGGVIAGNVVAAGNTSVRAMTEKTFTVNGSKVHIFAGDLLPAGTTVGGLSAQFKYDEAYVNEDDIICKVFVKLPPYMSAFEVGTSFFNPRSLTENQYLTFGHNTIEYLKNYPLITVKAI